MSEWKETELGLIPNEWEIQNSSIYCTKITDGTHDSPKQVFSGYPLITSKHIKGNSIDFEEAYLISQEDYEAIVKRSKVDQYDLIISMIGEYCGFTYLETSQQVDYATKNVGLFKNKSKTHALWLKYYLDSPIGKHQLRLRRSGTSQPYISLGSLRSLPILNPKSDITRQSIVNILSCLDAKIENLRRQNETLEQIARSLFKHWFIDFEFPNADGKPYKLSGGVMFASKLGDIPKSWHIACLNEYVNVINGYSYKGTELAESDTALINLKNFDRKGGFKVDGFKSLKTDNYKKQHIVCPDDLIVAHTDLTQNAEVLGNAALVQPSEKYTKYILSMDLVKLESKKDFLNNFFFYYLLSTREFKGHCVGYSNGTTVLHLSKKAIPEYTFPIPNEIEIITNFQNIASAARKKITNNTQQIQTLTKTRDSLLPKLMSGQLRVKE